MDHAERHKYTYGRQEVWEALRCLVGTEPITRWIALAVQPEWHGDNVIAASAYRQRVRVTSNILDIYVRLSGGLQPRRAGDKG
jgi:hypothetical protein